MFMLCLLCFCRVKPEANVKRLAYDFLCRLLKELSTAGKVSMIEVVLELMKMSKTHPTLLGSPETPDDASSYTSPLLDQLMSSVTEQLNAHHQTVAAQKKVKTFLELLQVSVF